MPIRWNEASRACRRLAGFSRSVLIAGNHRQDCSRSRAHARIRGAGRLRTYGKDRRYRSKLEILRDFLSAVRETGKKPRIIGVANLNPGSFQLYIEFCLANRLVEDTPAGYRLTPRADEVLKAIQQLIARSEEVDAALLQLQRGFEPSTPPLPSSRQALRYVSVLAWNEVVRSAAVSLAAKARALEGRLSVDLPVDTNPSWTQEVVETELEGPVAASPFLSGGVALPRRHSLAPSRESGRSEGAIITDPPVTRVVTSRWVRALAESKAAPAAEGEDLHCVTTPSKHPRRRA